MILILFCYIDLIVYIFLLTLLTLAKHASKFISLALVLNMLGACHDGFSFKNAYCKSVHIKPIRAWIYRLFTAKHPKACARAPRLLAAYHRT